MKTNGDANVRSQGVDNIGIKHEVGEAGEVLENG